MSDLPIVAVTALPAESFPGFLQAGANHVVAKPFTIESLRDPVMKLLGLANTD